MQKQVQFKNTEHFKDNGQVSMQVSTGVDES